MATRASMMFAAGWCMAACTFLAHAGPLDPACVDRQATWLVHADAQGLMSFEPARVALTNPESMFSRRMKRLQSDFGVDPRRDLLGMTLYGLGDSGSAAVSVLTMTAAADKIPGTLAAAGLTGFRTESDGGVLISTWVLRGESMAAAVRPGASPLERRVVIGASVVDVIRACRVVDGRQPSLTTPDQPPPALEALPQAGSLVFVAAVGMQSRLKDVIRAEAPPGDGPRGPEALLFRSLETLTIDAGRVAAGGPSDREAYFFSARATTRDDVAAQDCEAVVRGLIGMGCLAGRDNPAMAGVAKVAREMEVARSGTELRISTQQPAEAVVQLMKSLWSEGGRGDPVARRP
jgi:hypothetical protein